MSAEASNPRDIAVLALRDREGNVTAHLESRLARQRLRPENIALARELALGTYRRKATLDAIMRAYLARPDRRLPGSLQEIIWVGLYQAVMLDRIPAHAIANEAVKQAGRFRHRRQSGLVNGLLRSVLRGLSAAEEGPVPLDPDVVPVAPGRFRRLDRPAFPDASTDPVGYLAAAYSLPEVLARRWVRQFASLEAAIEVAMHADARAPLICRVNSLIGGVAEAVEALAAEGVTARPHANGVSVVLRGWTDVTRLETFRRGLIQPQDASATAVVLAAEPAPGMRVLDLCAAPGTKTTHLAERMENRGEIVAVDVSAEKLSRIEDNCRRMGVEVVRTLRAEEVGGLEVEGFDLVLVDAPCSNTGVLARRAEARWRFDERALSSLVEDQKFLLRTAGRFVRPGGRLVYSTCSIEPEEGPQVARWYAGSDSSVRLVRDELSAPAGADDPTAWRDGGYLAVFER